MEGRGGMEGERGKGRGGKGTEGREGKGRKGEVCTNRLLTHHQNQDSKFCETSWDFTSDLVFFFSFFFFPPSVGGFL